MKTETEAWKMLERALPKHPLLVLFAARRLIKKNGIGTYNASMRAVLCRLSVPLHLATSDRYGIQGNVATPEHLRIAAKFLRTPMPTKYYDLRRAADRAIHVEARRARVRDRSEGLHAAASRRWTLDAESDDGWIDSSRGHEGSKIQQFTRRPA